MGTVLVTGGSGESLVRLGLLSDSPKKAPEQVAVP